LIEWDFKWKEVTVLVIGDVMLDKWIYNTKTRISPEANVPIVMESEVKIELGGAANALRYLSKLSSGRHGIISVTGEDIAGSQIQALLGKNKNESLVIRDPTRITTVKERIYIDHQAIFRKDQEIVSDINTFIETRLISEIVKIGSKYSVILLSDYAKGVLTEPILEAIINFSRTHEVPLISDPGLGRLLFYAGCKVIKPNLVEWNHYVKSMGTEDLAKQYLFSKGTEFIVVTLGSQGVRLITESFDIVEKLTVSVKAVDVTGAGDSVAAALSLIVGSKMPLLENLKMLNKIGGFAVSLERTQLD